MSFSLFSRAGTRRTRLWRHNPRHREPVSPEQCTIAGHGAAAEPAQHRRPPEMTWKRDPAPEFACLEFPHPVITAAPAAASSACFRSAGVSHAEILFQRLAQPDQGRAVPRRSRPRLRADRRRHPHRRPVQAGLSRHQSERQGAGDRRRRRGRVRQQRHPALPRREDRKIPARKRAPGRTAVMADVRRHRRRPVLRPGRALQALRTGEGRLRPQPLSIRGAASRRHPQRPVGRTEIHGG